MTERLHFHFSLSCIGKGNGNPLQCSCLENPRDGGAWWAAIYGVAQSRTRLKWLSSSSLNYWTTREVLCHFMEGTWASRDSVFNAFLWSFFGAEASNLFPQKKLIFFMLSIQPLKGLGFKVRHTGGQACLYNWAPRTLWTPKAGWASLAVSTLCIITHPYWDQ